MGAHSLRVEVQVRSIHLIEPPQEVFGGSVYVVPSQIVGKVVYQWRSPQLLLE